MGENWGTAVLRAASIGASRPCRLANAGLLGIISACHAGSLVDAPSSRLRGEGNADESSVKGGGGGGGEPVDVPNMALGGKLGVSGASPGGSSAAGDAVGGAAGEGQPQPTVAPANAAGAGGDGGDSAGGWSPAALAGLALWLDAGWGVDTAGAGANRTVATWHDRSGNSNDASQSTATGQLRFMTGAINGRPAAGFDGRTDWLNVADSESLHLGKEPFAVALVASWTNSAEATDESGGYGTLLAKQTGGPPWTGLSLWGNNSYSGLPEATLLFQLEQPATWVTSNSAGLNDGLVRAYGARLSKPTPADSFVETRINSVVTRRRLDGPPPDISNPGVPLEIGGRGRAYQAMSGLIAEVVIVRGELSDEGCALLDDYFRVKYGLW